MDKYNIVGVAGNLVRDPDLRATSAGVPMLTFMVAVTNKVRDKRTGKLQDKPVLVPCAIYGAYAEIMAQTLKKGVGVVAHGRLGNFKDGEQRALNLVVETCIPVQEVKRKPRPAASGGVAAKPLADLGATFMESGSPNVEEAPPSIGGPDQLVDDEDCGWGDLLIDFDDD